MTNRRPLVLFTGAQNTIGRLPDGDAAIVEVFVDRNGVTWLKTVAVASAVNHLRANAAATGNGPDLMVEGADADIDLGLNSKGAGYVRANGDIVLSQFQQLPIYLKDLRDPSNIIPFTTQRGSVRYLVKDPGAATFTSVGFVSAITTDGTVTSADSTVRPLVGFTSAATSGTVAGLVTASNVVRRNWQPDVVIPIRFGPDVTNMRLWIGFTSADLATVTTPTTQHVAAFRYDTGAGDTNLQAVTCDGASTRDVQDTGYAPVADAHCELRIIETPSGVSFWIDDQIVHTTSTGMPGVNTSTAVRVRVEALANANKAVRVGSLALWMK